MDLCVCAWARCYFCKKFNPGQDSRMKAQIFSPEIAPSVYFVTETENHNTNNKPLAVFYNHMFHLGQRRRHTIPPTQLSPSFPPSLSLFGPSHPSNLPLPRTLHVLACTFKPDLFVWLEKKEKKTTHTWRWLIFPWSFIPNCGIAPPLSAILILSVIKLVCGLGVLGETLEQVRVPETADSHSHINQIWTEISLNVSLLMTQLDS